MAHLSPKLSIEKKNYGNSVYSCHPSDLPCEFSSIMYPSEGEVSDGQRLDSAKDHRQRINDIGEYSPIGVTRAHISSKASKTIATSGYCESRTNDLYLPNTTKSSRSLKFPFNPTSRCKAPRPKSEKDKRKSNWKKAVDPKSGRAYYYDTVTRATQWHKPMELTSMEERIRTAAKERKQRDFFAAMESNILKCLALGSLPGTTSPEPAADRMGKQGPPVKNKFASKPPRCVRTISAMNENVLKELVYFDGSSPTSVSVPPDVNCKGENVTEIENESFLETWLRNGTNPSPLEKDRYDTDILASNRNFETNESLLEREYKEFSGVYKDVINENESHENSQQVRPVLGSRRNTCGTLYIGTTMSAPDKEATIKCVCAVYRAHILQSIKEEESSSFFEEYEVFNDLQFTSSHNFFDDDNTVKGMEREYSDDTLFSEDILGELYVPALEEITSFYRTIFLMSKMESDCIIISLIYVEKIMRATNNGVRPTLENWRSLIFSCMIMASKVWDDFSMLNVDFTEACPAGVSFSLQRVNELEMAVLHCLNYEVKVLASEYAKYYFLLRSMLIQSGLGSEEFSSSNPLNLEGAKQLEYSSSNYKPNGQIRRAKSTGDKTILSTNQMNRTNIISSKAVLEHVVKM